MRSIRFGAEFFLAFFLLLIFNLLSPGIGEADDASVTATGYFYYTEQRANGTTQDMPIKNAKVVMCDNDGLTGCEKMAEGWTDESGYFKITGSGSDPDFLCIGDLGCGLPDPLVYVEADSNVAVVRKPLATLDPTAPYYCFKSYTKLNIPTSTEDFPEDFGIVTPSNGLKCQSEPVSAAGEDGAWHIFTTIYEANTFMWSHTPAMNIPKATAFWPDWDDQNFYRPPILFDGGAISLESSSAWNEATIVHEYGHHIVTHYTNSGLELWTFPIIYQNDHCDPGHCAWEPENDPIAFFEGWPTFISAMVGTHYNYDNVYNLEDHDDQGFQGQEEHIENFNAAILWDLYDAADDDQCETNGYDECGAGKRDDAAIGIYCMWNALIDSGSGSPSTSIHEFWNGLKAPGTGCSGWTNWISEIYREHHIIKPQPDLASYLSGEPPASGVYGTGFLVASSVYNHGDEVTNAAVTNRYYLSIDTVFDAFDKSVGEHVVPPLNTGANYALQISATIPGTLPADYYYLIVCADAYGEVPESNETNNCHVSSTRIQVTLPVIQLCFTDTDGDGYKAYAPDWDARECGFILTKNYDCNDSNAAVKPGAAEVCNGVDDNCSGSIDEGVKNTFYMDIDGDGYGNVNNAAQACTQPIGYVTNTGDCNDNSSSVHPGAAEICNSADDNCNGQADEGGVCTTVSCGGKTATIIGTAGDDVLKGTAGDDVIAGLGGNDTINGFGGNDTICGGSGNDVLDGGPGNDTIGGGPGIDTVSYASSTAGVTVNLSTSTATGQGSDTLVSGTIEWVIGSKYNDTLTGNAAKNSLKGGAGNDALYGRGGDDALNGGAGTDTCDGGSHTTGDISSNCETMIHIP